MKKALLLDTNILLFWFFDSKRIRPILKDLKKANIHVSLMSLWEITIKVQIAKLTLPMPLEEFFQIVESGFSVIDFSTVDIEFYSALPLHHRDPFDRMIIAQAQARGLCLVSADQQLARYELKKIILE